MTKIQPKPNVVFSWEERQKIPLKDTPESKCRKALNILQINIKPSFTGALQKDVLQKFSNFTGKHLSRSLFFSKVAGILPEVWLKGSVGQAAFPWNLRNFSGQLFVENLQ